MLSWTGSSAQIFDWVTQLDCGAITTVYDMTLDADGNQFISGYTSSSIIYSSDSGEDTLSIGMGFAAFVFKLSPSGNVLLAKAFQCNTFIESPCVAVDESGNIYLTGGYRTILDADPGPEEFILNSNGIMDIFIIKLDSTGNLVWAKSMGGGNSDAGQGIAIDSDGNVISAGKFGGSSPVDFNPAEDEEAYLSVQETGRTYIQKLDSNGEFIWVKGFGGSDISGFKLDDSDNIHIIGQFQGNFGTSDFDPGEGEYMMSSVSQRDIFVLKLDADANFIWAKSLGGTYQENANSFDIDSEGNIYLTGTFRMDIDLDPGPDQQVEVSIGDWDIFIVKLNDSGSLEWGHAIGAEGYKRDEGLSIAVNEEGDVYTTGRFEGDIDFQPGTVGMQLSSPEDKSVYVAKLDTYGNFIWVNSFATSHSDQHIAVDSYGGVYRAGNFTGTVDFDPDSTEAVLTFNWPKSFYVSKWFDDGDNCASTVNGRMFFDLNENSVFDEDEPPYPHGNYSVSWMPYQFLAQSNGTFQQCAPVGMHSVTIESLPDYYESTIDFNSFEMVQDQPVENQNFPLIASKEVFDLEVFIWADEPNIPGFTRNYIVEYSNLGTVCAENVEISVNLDNSLDLISVSTPNYSVNEQEVIIQIGTVCPFETGSIVLELNLPASVPLGQELLSTALITPMAGDENPLNNKDEYATIVIGSFDPNDKNVSHSIIHPDFLVNRSYLRYLIRFQNTGTYYAQNVVVKDPVSSHLDISSFRLLDVSHPVKVEYIDEELHFIFEDIMLPDSLTNEPESHGYINFLVKPRIDMPLGSVVENTAYIYFDFNEPIITNTTETHYMLPAVEAEENEYQIQVYPNPARNSIHVTWGTLSATGFEILDGSGRRLIADQISEDENQIQIPVEQLRSGMYFFRLFGHEGTSTLRWLKN